MPLPYASCPTAVVYNAVTVAPIIPGSVQVVVENVDPATLAVSACPVDPSTINGLKISVTVTPTLLKSKPLLVETVVSRH